MIILSIDVSSSSVCFCMHLIMLDQMSQTVIHLSKCWQTRESVGMHVELRDINMLYLLKYIRRCFHSHSNCCQVKE